jgi:hypothetical protein
MVSLFTSALAFHKEAPSTAAFQPVDVPKCSAVFGHYPHTPVAWVTPQDAVILRAQNRIGGVPPVCHLAADGSRPLHRLYDEPMGTRPEYTEVA